MLCSSEEDIIQLIKTSLHWKKFLLISFKKKKNISSLNRAQHALVLVEPKNVLGNRDVKRNERLSTLLLFLFHVLKNTIRDGGSTAL